MSGWKVLVFYFLPPPLVLLMLMILPLPKVLQKGIITFARNVLFLTVFGSVRLVHFAIAISGLSFGGCINTLLRLQKQVSDTAALGPAQVTQLHAKRWREERNFWIGFMTFFLWCVVYRFFFMALKMVEMQDRLEALEGPPAPGAAHHSLWGSIGSFKSSKPAAPVKTVPMSPLEISGQPATASGTAAAPKEEKKTK